MQLPSTSQTNPQGLAAISMGNPAPLQKRVAQSPKDPQTGFPQDLAAALALSIVNTEQDAAKRQAAMQQLQQAMGPAGQMPTVVQGLQQAAAQKLRQMPQQQGQPEQMAQAPQSAGIDQAPVEFGMAGGGIVSFNGEDGSKVKSDISKEELEEEEQKKRDAKLLGENWEEAKASFKDIASLPLRGVAGAAESVITRPLRAMGINMPYLPSSVYGGDRTSMTPMYDKVLRERAAAEQKQKAGLSQAGAGRGRVNPPLVDPDAPRPAVIRHLGDYQPSAQDMALIEEDIRKTGNTSPTTRFMYPDRAAPATDSYQPTAIPSDLRNLINQPTAATKPTQSAAPAALSVDPAISKILALDPEAKQKAHEERLQKFAPDTATSDRLIAELEKRKQSLNRPKEGLPGVVDYLKQIVATGPQRDWMSAGAKGALGVEAADKAAAQAQHDITVQQINAAETANEKKRLFQLETIKAGQDAYNKTYDRVFNAAKEVGENNRAAAKIASEEAQNIARITEQARGHTLNAQVRLLEIQTLDRRQQSTDNKAQLKAEADERTAAVNALRATAKEMGENLKDPAFMASLQKSGGAAQYTALYNASLKALAKIGGVDTANIGFVEGPSTNVRAPLK